MRRLGQTTLDRIQMAEIYDSGSSWRLDRRAEIDTNSNKYFRFPYYFLEFKLVYIGAWLRARLASVDPPPDIFSKRPSFFKIDRRRPPYICW